MCFQIIEFQKNKYRSIEILSLLIAAVSAVLIAGEAADWKELFSVFNLWIVLPYILFFIISTKSNQKSKSSIVPIASCLTALLILSFTLLVYIDSFYISASSTSALVFIFVPFYIVVGGPIAFYVLYSIINTSQKRKNQST